MNEVLLFLLKTLLLGLVTGFVAGYLFKKISKAVVIIAAIIVVAIFVLGHNELLNIDWLSVKETGNELYLQIFKKYEARLILFFRNIPFVLGFIIGSILGLKMK
jgi:uncharacterized membrane protein (Fun14 family)